MNALTVTETSSGSVHSGSAVAIIYKESSASGYGMRGYRTSYLINELTSVDVVRNENLSPKVELTTFHEVASLLLEHRVVVRNRNQLIVAEALRVRNICEVRIALLTVFANHERLVNLMAECQLCRWDKYLDRRTLFSFKNASGLLLLSM